MECKITVHIIILKFLCGFIDSNWLRTVQNICAYTFMEKIGKAVAQKSKQKIARECLKDKATKQYTLEEVNKLIQTEIHSVCSFDANSIMESQSVENLKEFEWSKILHKLAERAPTFLSTL